MIAARVARREPLLRSNILVSSWNKSIRASAARGPELRRAVCDDPLRPPRRRGAKSSSRSRVSRLRLSSTLRSTSRQVWGAWGRSSGGLFSSRRFFLRLIHLRTSCLINLSASHVFAFLHAAPRAGPSKQRARRLVRTLPSQRRWRFRQRRASWCMQQCHMCKCCFWGGSLHGARRAAKAGRGGAP